MKFQHYNILVLKGHFGIMYELDHKQEELELDPPEYFSDNLHL